MPRPYQGLLALVLWCPLLGAQPPQTLEADSLDFYRIQAFLAPVQERIKLNHIGILGEANAEGFLIGAVLEGYPAAVAGLTRGDVIIESEGEEFHSVFSFNQRDAAPLNFLPSTRSINLTVKRGTDLLDVSVAPVFENLFDSLSTATLNSVQQFSAGNKVIGYVHFWALSRSSNELIAYQALIDSLAQCDGLILDLRNSFGFLDRDHLGLFQATDPRLEITAPAEWLANWQHSNSSIDSEAFRKPVTILINEHTQGGAEVLAHELAKPQRIVTLGTATKGTVGNFYLENENTIHYQSFQETLIDGEPFEGAGLQPEYLLEFPTTESRRDDPQFNESINLLLGII